MVETKTSDILQDTRKLQIRKIGTNQGAHIHASGVYMPLPEPPNSSQPRVQLNQQTQLKASRDVRFANVQLSFQLHPFYNVNSST